MRLALSSDGELERAASHNDIMHMALGRKLPKALSRFVATIWIWHGSHPALFQLGSHMEWKLIEWNVQCGLCGIHKVATNLLRASGTNDVSSVLTNFQTWAQRGITNVSWSSVKDFRTRDSRYL